MEENNQTYQEVKDTEDNKKGPVFKKYFSVIWEFLKIIIIASLIVLPIRYFLFQPFIVKGESMVPNFQSGDYLIVDEISYRVGSPQRGNVAVFKYPLDTTQRFIKRIIGLPGETIDIRNGKITISKNGEILTLDEKNYLSNLNDTDGDINIVLKENEYFVLGDNRQFSYDSRRWGVLPRKYIIGRAIFRVFPISAMSYIPELSY